MIRKVIKQAGQAYTITLPIEWVRNNKINENSEVDVKISEKSLIINSSGQTEIKKAKIDADKFDKKSIKGHLNALYASGVDEIELESKEDISSIIIKSLNQNIGYALISHENNKYIIKDVSGSNYQNLDEIFKRVFQMTLLFYDSAMKDIFGKQEETREGLDARDFEVNKFCLYLERAINKMSYPDIIKGRVLFTYSFEIERIADEIHRLWRTNIKSKVKKTAAIKELIELSSEGLGLSFDFYYQFDIEKLKKIYELREKVREKSLSLLRLDAITARFVRHAVKIIEDAADLTQLTLMMRL
jgi:phosphate uptake regulator